MYIKRQVTKHSIYVYYNLVNICIKRQVPKHSIYVYYNLVNINKETGDQAFYICIL